MRNRRNNRRNETDTGQETTAPQTDRPLDAFDTLTDSTPPESLQSLSNIVNNVVDASSPTEQASMDSASPKLAQTDAPVDNLLDKSSTKLDGIVDPLTGDGLQECTISKSMDTSTSAVDWTDLNLEVVPVEAPEPALVGIDTAALPQAAPLAPEPDVARSLCNNEVVEGIAAIEPPTNSVTLGFTEDAVGDVAPGQFDDVIEA